MRAIAGFARMAGSNSGLLRPFLHTRGRVTLKLLHQSGWVGIVQQHIAILWPQESLAYGVVKVFQQVIKIAAYIEDSTRLAVKFQLSPGQHLDEFLESSEAAGHRNESVR